MFDVFEVYRRALTL